MNCGTCGIQNVEFANTCYSCGKPLAGRLRSAYAPVLQPPPQSEPHGVEIPRPKVPSGFALGLGRLLFFAAIAFFFFREPIRQILNALRSTTSESTETVSEPSSPAVPEPPSQTAQESPPEVLAPEPPPPPPPKKAAEAAADEYPAAEPPDEINGFRMTLFQWDFAEGQSEPVHFGDVVKGQSQISGFDVSKDNRIDLTMRFTFRDPRGRVLEKSNPSRLDQPVESETLFSSFDYTIPKKGPAGDYELEIGVDDAVSGRSARFRRTITAVR